MKREIGLLALTAAVAMVPADAEAGRKKKGRKNMESIEAVAPADEGVSVGRPAEAEFLELPCPYVEGAVFTYRTDRVPRNGSPMAYTLELRVVSADASGFVVDVGGETLEVGDAPIDQKLEAFNDALEVEPRFRYDAATSELELLNLEAYLAAMAPMEGILREHLVGMGAPPEAIEAAVAAALDPGQLVQSAMEPLFPLTTYTCGALNLGVLEYRSELGHPAFPGQGVASVGRIEAGLAAPDRFVATKEERADPEALRALTQQVMAQAVPPEQVEGVMAELAKLELELVERLQAEVDPATGIVQRVSSSSVVTVPGQGPSTETRETVLLTE